MTNTLLLRDQAGSAANNEEDVRGMPRPGVSDGLAALERMPGAQYKHDQLVEGIGREKVNFNVYNWFLTR